MKQRHRIWAVGIALLLAVGALTTAVFAARDDDIVRPSSISVKNVFGNPKTKTMTVDSSFTISYVIRPDDADSYLDVTFDSSNWSIAEVDDMGVVTANEPGECTITVMTENYKRDTFIVRVLGKQESGYDTSGYLARDTGEQDSDTARSSSRSASASSSSKTASSTSGSVPQIKLTAKVDRDTLIAQVRGTGSGKTPTLSNYNAVSADSLRAAGEAGAGAVQFDTMNDSKVIGRLTVYTEYVQDMHGDLRLGVYCNTSNTASVDKRFADYYKNNFRVVLIDHQQFYMPVRVAVKVGELSGKNLKFYGYDAVNGNYYDVKVTDAKVDSKGYLYFTTEVGGYIIVSDGTLTIK